jgi:protein ImuB
MFAAILLPSFHLQAALRFEPELHRQPVALLAGPGPTGAIVTETTAAARAAEVQAGFTASQALARCPGLQLRRRLPQQEQAATEVLRQTAWAFSPWLEPTAAGLCTLDLRGRSETQHRAWALTLMQRLATRQLFARVGVAGNPDLARLAARRARPFLQLADAAAFLAPLPLAELEPDPTLEMIIAGWGVRTLGALTALPREAVGDRLGPTGMALWDRAAGRTTRTLDFAHAVETYHEIVEFEHGLETLEPLLFVLRRCLEQITQRLADAWLVVATLRLELRCDDGGKLARTFSIPDPTGDVDVLFRVLHHYFETLRTEAPVVALELEARPTKPLSHQFGMFQAALKDPNGFAETLARLAAVVGDDRVGTPELERTHRPDAFRIARVDFASPPIAPDSVAERPPRYGPALRRFRPPVSARVECDPAGQPLEVEAAGTHGRIRFALGPWRGSGDWWEDRRAWNDEEWDVELEPGRLFRLSRRNAAWWVVGGYD